MLRCGHCFELLMVPACFTQWAVWRLDDGSLFSMWKVALAHANLAGAIRASSISVAALAISLSMMIADCP